MRRLLDDIPELPAGQHCAATCSNTGAGGSAAERHHAQAAAAAAPTMASWLFALNSRSACSRACSKNMSLQGSGEGLARSQVGPPSAAVRPVPSRAPSRAQQRTSQCPHGPGSPSWRSELLLGCDKHRRAQASQGGRAGRPGVQDLPANDSGEWVWVTCIRCCRRWAEPVATMRPGAAGSTFLRPLAKICTQLLPGVTCVYLGL